MSELATTSRNVKVASPRTIVVLIALGLIVAGLFAVGMMLRPAAVLTPPTTSALQVPARDDFAFRQTTALSASDDYALRSTAVRPIVPAAGRQDDYAVRHPIAASAAADTSDFALRHQSWTISAQQPSRDDYGLR
jgi:hypothetical protein